LTTPPTKPQIVRYPRTKMEDTEWNPMDPKRVVAGSPRSSYKIIYSHPSKEFYSGIFECTAGKWNVNYGEDEYCTLVEGKVVLTGEDGIPNEFSAPESFLIPAGFKGTWEAQTYVRRYFVIYEKLK
jgi:uncharacterized cupin superfamily protein